MDADPGSLRHGFFEQGDTDRFGLVPEENEPKTTAQGGTLGDGGDPQADAGDMSIFCRIFPRTNSPYIC